MKFRLKEGNLFKKAFYITMETETLITLKTEPKLFLNLKKKFRKSFR